MTGYLIICFIATLLVPISGYHGFGGYTELIAAGMSLPSAIALLYPLICWRSDNPPTRPPAPLIYPLIALATGRSIALIINLPDDPFCNPWTMSTMAGISAFYVARRNPQQIRSAFRLMAYPLVSLAFVQTFIGLQDTFLNRNVLGGLLAICLGAFLPDISSRFPEIRGKNVYGAVLVAAGIFATGSRGGIIAAGVTFSIFFGLFVKTLPVMVVSIPFLLQIRNPAALKLRLGYWIDGILAWLKHPLFGIGPQHLPCGAGHVHNMYLSILVWSGLAGTGLMILAIWLSRAGWKRLPLWALASLAGFFAQGFVDDLTPFPMVMVIVGAVMATTISSDDRSTQIATR